MALLHFWKSNKEIVLAQGIQQVVANAGDGNLRDGSLACEELRSFLGEVPSKSLFEYVRQCLEIPFPKSGYVLQDIVNELGRRLDFDVESGLYQGRRNAVGYDGIWKSGSEPELIVEVKTTDAYTMNLDTTNNYKERLIEAGKVSKAASILLVVGREDTGALEAQVRGSRFAWDMRMISVDRLMKLVEIKQKSDDLATGAQIRQLLHPFEYTKIDKIIDVIFTTATDVESQQETAKEILECEEAPGESPRAGQNFTDPVLLNAKREKAIQAFSVLRGKELIKRSRTFFWSADKELRVCCTVSKRYEGDYQPYWYAYHPKWDEFLSAAEGYLVLCCMDLDSAFAIPHTWLEQNKANLNSTQKPDGTLYWHIPLTFVDGKLAINLTRIGKKYELEAHRFRVEKSQTESFERR
ncbi:MAG TPA: hypothetical protein VKX25_07600 [Bryobacteraceae bacterium]|jgi:hypothetical protein|nr:hypothetical protein [Bryobacteraceae bacterium]